MQKWSIDPDHTVAAFCVRHLMIANVRGQFNRISGTVHFDPLNAIGLSLEAEIDVAGIYTGIGKRDDHLRSPDFFDAERLPTITFRSTGYEPTGKTTGRLAGRLTIHGIPREIILDVTLSGPVTAPAEIGGETTLALSARTSLNREDFGMTWNVPFGDGGVVVGREVEIHLDIEADRQ
ncbi:MAG: YceI family protein [Thermodesulfobacteriota bacterium]